MKITEETKIKDLIPEGFELDEQKELYQDLDIDNTGLITLTIKKKSKILEDYENELGENVGWWTHAIKKNFPRQYYSIILEMIADDICEEGKERHYILFEHADNDNICSISLRANYLGTVKFDTEKHAEQAVEIMGDKLKLLI